MAEGQPEVIMVVGGAGFLGQHVVKELQERAENVREIKVFDLKPYENKLGHAENKPISSVVGDLRNLSDVSDALEGVDSVILTAGLISFGTFPDFQGMEEVNVKGTSNVIQACIKQRVSRLIYTSTIDVVVGYDEIHDGDETLPIPRKLLFPGYPDTKYRGEQLVLAAHGRPLGSDDGARLRTLALRPNVMYGAQDPYFVVSALKSAKKRNGILTKVGNGEALFQQAYVGNIAWAHVAANQALTRHDDVGGHVYFVTDDTPLMTTFEFMEPFLKARGYALSSYSIPYPLVYCMLLAAESACKVLQPLKKIELGMPLCSLIYVNKTFYFNRARAEKMLDYKPVYDYKDALSKSIEYYSTANI